MAVKRPSLAESMRQAAQPDALPQLPQAASPVVEPAPPVAAGVPRVSDPERTAPKPQGFYAATRAGKKKVTAALTPAMHKTLKGLAVAHDTTTEALLLEAIGDLLTKHSADRAA